MNYKLYSVAEYAGLIDISTQAVYKQISTGKINTVQVREKGKLVKKIKVELDLDNKPILPEVEIVSNPDTPEHTEPEENPELNLLNQPFQPFQPEEKTQDKLLDTLIEQLKEKDKQIELLQEANKEQQKDIKEKDKIIKEQIEKLNNLLQTSQLLQGQTNNLLLKEKNNNEREPEEDNKINIPALKENKVKEVKKGFWSRFFNV